MANEELTQIWIEAIDAFYAWEIANDIDNLSDDDRGIWCEGYVQAILNKEAYEC